MPEFDFWELLITIPAVLLALTFHEAAHGFVAYKLGDTTARDCGRLTLNPFRHIDPLGLFMYGAPCALAGRNLSLSIRVASGTHGATWRWSRSRDR